MIRFVKVSLGLLLPALLLLPVGSAAQSAQPYSFQVSLLGSIPGGDLGAVTAGFGWEAQVRSNPGAFSFGLGIEQTFHGVDNLDDRNVRLTGGFFEPRYVIDTGSDKAVPYLAGRFAISQMHVEEFGASASTTGYTVNGGGGLLIRLKPAMNLDLGVTLGWKDLGTTTIVNNVVDFGTGTNLIIRAGLAFGFGG